MMANTPKIKSFQKVVPMIYAYNMRLNLAGVRRTLFEGFDNFMAYDNDTTSVYDFYVTIRTDEGEKIVHHQSGSTCQKQGFYFFYPDSRASHVTIFKGNVCICDEDLKEHNGLNGAVLFNALPKGQGESTLSRNRPTVSTDLTEYLPNQIITSEVNNPWIFKAEGYNTVGIGEIIGVVTTTMALSQDAFGRTDLLVFTNNGMWGMSVDKTGLYQSAHPFGREVCISQKSITQVDGAVFFVSDKGLMMATDADVKCVSEQLSGRTNALVVDSQSLISDLGDFNDFLKSCFIAYDYRDSLLWIFNDQYSVCYIYSIKTGTFGKYDFETNGITNVVNNYPDYLLQSGSAIYSLTGRDNINDDENEYEGTIITRPMKLENGLALKSIMQIRNIGQMDGSLELHIYGSNDLEHWFEKDSLRGVPWKYYRFRYVFDGMSATDRFSGAVVVTQERRPDKLR
mgnify:CR=1 FL=1